MLIALVFLGGVLVGWLGPRLIVHQSSDAIPLSKERREILIAHERGH